MGKNKTKLYRSVYGRYNPENSAVTSDSPTCAGLTLYLDPRVVRSRERLLSAATDLLVEFGPRAVTIEAVVARSGVAKSTMYRQWSSREELLVDVMRANRPVLACPDPGLGFETSLRTMMHELAITLATPEWSALLPALISLQRHMPELKEMSEVDRDAKVDVLRSVLRLGATEGHVPPDLDPHRAAHILIGPVVFTIISGQTDEATEIADYAVDRFIASYET